MSAASNSTPQSAARPSRRRCPSGSCRPRNCSVRLRTCLSIMSRIRSRQLRAVENPLAVAVDPLPLVVHHLVVFEQVLADVEVALLDLLLGLLDAAGDHPALDRLAFLHAEPGEHARRPTRRRRSASGRLRATGRTGSSPGRPAGRPGRGAELSMRRASCRSVPMMCRPPISATLRPSSFMPSPFVDLVDESSSHSALGTSSREAYFVLAARPRPASRGCRRG